MSLLEVVSFWCFLKVEFCHRDSSPSHSRSKHCSWVHYRWCANDKAYVTVL